MSGSVRVLERLLPRAVDGRLRGHPLALWLFVPIVLVSIARSVIHIVRSDGGAQSIATIPLDAFTPEGAATVVAIFAQWGLSQLLLAIVFAVVLFRYRALLPLMYLLLVVEYTGRIVIGSMKPIVTVGTPPGGPGSFVAIGMALVGLGASLWWKEERREGRAKEEEEPPAG